MSGFGDIEGGLRGSPLVADSKKNKKKPGLNNLNRVETEAWSASETAQIIF